MSFKSLFYAYVLGGLTFIPLLIAGAIFITIYTSVPVGDADVSKPAKAKLENDSEEKGKEEEEQLAAQAGPELNDLPRTRKGWLTMRRTFDETPDTGGYMGMMRTFLDSRSKDPKRSKPRDMWYVVLKGRVLYLYEDEAMLDCEAVIELSSHVVVVYPEGLPDAELFAKRNAICLKPKLSPELGMPSITREMAMEPINVDEEAEEKGNGSEQKVNQEKERLTDAEKQRDEGNREASNPATPWFIFVRSNVEMEDWYLSLVHASDNPPNLPTLTPLLDIFRPVDMESLVNIIDAQPDVIPMRWLNALLGRIFLSYYRTQRLESEIIRRIMKKLSKVKRPTFLSDISVTDVNVGNASPMLSKPMLKELTREGDASFEVRLQYKGEVRITVEATATINLGARFKSYTVKVVLAVVLRELDGNLLVKVKRPPSNRIWYAFTQNPKMVLDVVPVVSDRQITWTMILSQIESRLKEIIHESVVMPNMDDVSFFESRSYSHRGGIWPESARKAYRQEDSTGQGDRPLSTVSNLETASKSDSVLTPGIELSADDAASDPSPDSIPNVDAVDSNTSQARRRTWFTTVAKQTVPDEVSNAEPTSSSPPRGRFAESEPALQPSHPRSRSSPGHGSDRHAQDEASAGTASSYDSNRHHTPSLSERIGSSSPPLPSKDYQYFPSSDDASMKSSTMDATSASPSLSRTTSARSSTSNNTTPTSPSFFATLKSRAAATDKAAISNQAKEAMRKLTVNWNSLKRNSNDGNSGRDASFEENWEGSSVEQRARAESQRSRGSWADMKGAYEDRKEKTPSATPVADMFQRTDGSSEAIPIPDAGGSKSRTVSVGSASSFAASIAGSSSSRDSANVTTKSAAPPIVSRSPSGVGSAAQMLDSDDELPAPVPIRTQPNQAKTMMIPGIHASHRGEVMSMGYVAPPPSSPTLENKMKSSPAIQSVYRLWKNPASAGSAAATSSEGENDPSAGAATNGSIGHLENSAAQPEAPAPSAPRSPVPPPLPPRAVPTPRPAPTQVQEGENNVASPTPEALKSITTKDAQLSRVELEPTSTSSSSAIGETADISLPTLLPTNEAGENISNFSESVATPLLSNPNSQTVTPQSFKPPLPPRRPTSTPHS